MDKEIADKINMLQKEIDKKVEQYSNAQKRYKGDNALSDRLESEIDSLDLQIKELEKRCF